MEYFKLFCQKLKKKWKNLVCVNLLFSRVNFFPPKFPFPKYQCWQPNHNPKFTKNLTDKNPVFSGFSKINFRIKNTEFSLQI
jgi:hypothetical protein